MLHDEPAGDQTGRKFLRGALSQSRDGILLESEFWLQVWHLLHLRAPQSGGHGVSALFFTSYAFACLAVQIARVGVNCQKARGNRGFTSELSLLMEPEGIDAKSSNQTVASTRFVLTSSYPPSGG